MSVAAYTLTEPYLQIANAGLFSIFSTDPLTAAESLLGFAGIYLPLNILLNTVSSDGSSGRSLGEDQALVYRELSQQLTDQLNVDGQACLLRFLCELKQRPLEKWSFVGRLLSLLLTPQRSEGTPEQHDPLHEYLTAHHLTSGTSGDGTCALYHPCPISVFQYFQDYNNNNNITIPH